jgi:8-oxo-dGTP diphosphatase
MENSPFQGKVRIRICGVLVENGRLLLVKHRGLGPEGYYWSPPGGGMEFGESCRMALVREMKEETGLEVISGEFLAFHEHIDQRFHAMELFFRVQRLGGTLILGIEPESVQSGPVLEEIAWFSREELEQLPAGVVHSLCPKFFG